MRFGGIVPEDAPDPRERFRARLAKLPFAVARFTPQPHLEEHRGGGWTESGDGEMSVSLSYTLWRHPGDREDPRNLAEIDDVLRRSLEPPPWPRPAWVVETAELFRYPMLWEAVSTHWRKGARPEQSLDADLVHHANHVLRNRFREELALPPGPTGPDGAWQVTETHIRRDRTLEVDGAALPASVIDTDPFVFAVGARLDDRTCVTVVLPRDDLPLVELTLTTAGAELSARDSRSA